MQNGIRQQPQNPPTKQMTPAAIQATTPGSEVIPDVTSLWQWEQTVLTGSCPQYGACMTTVCTTGGGMACGGP